MYFPSLVLAGLALAPTWSLAQVPTSSEAESARPAVSSGEPTLGLDAEGRVTIRAVRVTGPMSVDGRLDEAVYGMVPAAEEFIQQEPREGDPTSERTEAWILFDEENIYVSIRAWDSEPDRRVANELRRDTQGISQGDNIAVAFDTFFDRRNGFFFQTNPLGALRDQEITNEGNPNLDWNAIWDVKTEVFDQGWTAEMAIPFRSLRYPQGGPQVWGVNIRRVIPWRNEDVYLTRVPASYANFGIFRFSVHATLLGLEAPPQALALEVKPYAAAGLSTDRAAAEPFSNRRTRDVGFDVKWGVTPSLTADLTVNTDFAQVESDDEQVNLTRFSLTLPEKREFFLEGRGIFAFGNSTAMGGGAAGAGGPTGGGGGMMGGGAQGDVPVMFFSRQIGLSSETAVPVLAGGRLTGRVGAFTVGAVHVRTGDADDGSVPPTDFSVVRLKRNILSRSSVGLIATRRSPSMSEDGVNTALGLDAAFPFRTDWEIIGYYARSWSRELSGDETSYRGQVTYNGDRYGLQLGHTKVGDDFNPEVGFVRRWDFRQSAAMARFSPRFPSIPWIRRLVWQGNVEYVTNESGDLIDSRDLQGQFRLEMQSGDIWMLQYTHRYEAPIEAFTIQGIQLPAGEYRYGSMSSNYMFGPQRRISGRVNLQHGEFYSGHRTGVTVGGRVEVSSRLSLEPNFSQNRVELPENEFTTRLMTLRGVFTPSARAAVSSLLQYNSSNSTWSSNVRLRWEYSPGSELFLVYSDGRDTGADGFPELETRTLALKVTYLVRF